MTRVLLGRLTVWCTDFFGAETVAVLPYEQYLKPALAHDRSTNNMISAYRRLRAAG